jgi:hypothetical protein
MYKHPIGRTGWVKATDRLPGYEKPVKWRDGNDHTHVTDGKIPLINMAKPFLIGWEWYDESPNEQPVEKKENEAVSISLMKEKHEAEIALYETRISLYRLMKAFEKENKTSSQQKYYDQADSILNKHFSVKDVLR